jgi:hypothetical protein
MGSSPGSWRWPTGSMPGPPSGATSTALAGRRRPPGDAGQPGAGGSTPSREGPHHRHRGLSGGDPGGPGHLRARAVVVPANPDPERLHQPEVKILSDGMGSPWPSPSTSAWTRWIRPPGSSKRSIIKTADPVATGSRWRLRHLSPPAPPPPPLPTPPPPSIPRSPGPSAPNDPGAGRPGPLHLRRLPGPGRLAGPPPRRAPTPAPTSWSWGSPSPIPWPTAPPSSGPPSRPWRRG